jgi:geranylgeranyl diphosphate synthase, type I
VNVTPARPLPAAVSGVAARVNERLAHLFDLEQARWSGVDPDLGPPLDVLRSYVMSGGKRLRPAFCYWAFVGAGGAPHDPAVIDGGAALEMLHTAALVHDDVIDGSDRRHGAETVHVQQAGYHRASGWRGNPDGFGAGAAIVLGDLALVYSGRLLAGSPAGAISVFDEMRLEVNVGQYLDILGAAQGVDLPGQAAVDRARRICRYKTAKYTVERPLHLGAALASPGALADLAGPLSRFGLPLGEAFQLRDDLLGVFGDSAVTGKPVGDDLREGKPTLLASLAANKATGASARLIAGRFGAPDLSVAEVAELQEIIQATGARTRVEQAIVELLGTAMEALGALPLRPEAVSALGEIGAFVAGRDY